MSEIDPKEAVASWKSAYHRDNVNAAWLLVGRHSQSQPDADALHVVRATGEDKIYSFAMLDDLSARLASALTQLGVGPGDRVAALLPKGPELTLTALAAWRIGASYVPLFTAFGDEAIAYRLRDSHTAVLVTDHANRHKISREANDLLKAIVLVPLAEPATQDLSFDDLLDSAPLHQWAPLTGDSPMVLLYTSGTTGQPKGVVVPIWALAAFEAYMRLGLDLRSTDRFWNLADPGWAYGLYYGLIGPLLLGQSTLAYQGPFDPQTAVSLLRRYHITNFAAAPTAFRAMRATGLNPQNTELRVLSSAGEPLNPEVSQWSREIFGLPIYDHYGQTELGMVINNHHFPPLQRPVQPGSMGVVMPGFRAVIVDDAGNELEPGQEGHLAIDTKASPLFWFAGYYNAPDRTRERFTPDGRYYLTGDDASHDPEGHFYFSGRSDDIILSAGYRIGPFEVENVLMTHPAVAECAVIGIPDELRGEAVKAYIVLRATYLPGVELSTELKEWVRQKLAKTAYPRELEFVESLPKTPSGKVQRYRLRNS